MAVAGELGDAARLNRVTLGDVATLAKAWKSGLFRKEDRCLCHRRSFLSLL